MPQVIATLLSWLVFWGMITAVMVFTDRRIAARRRAGQGGDVFVESRPTKYIAAALCVGGLVLPVYFYSVHRSLKGALIGFAWLAGILLVLSRISLGVSWVADVMTQREPDLQNLEPEDGSTRSNPVVLSVFAHDAQDGNLTGGSIQWQSESQGPLGEGEMLVRSMPPGKHQVTITVTDSDGNKVSDVTTFTVTP